MVCCTYVVLLLLLLLLLLHCGGPTAAELEEDLGEDEVAEASRIAADTLV